MTVSVFGTSFMDILARTPGEPKAIVQIALVLAPPLQGALLNGATQTLVVQGASVSAVFDLTSANGPVTMTPGTFDGQQVYIGFLGAENGFTGVFSVPVGGTANLMATGFNGVAQTSIPAGQTGSTVTFTWIANANAGAGQWLKS